MSKGFRIVFFGIFIFLNFNENLFAEKKNKNKKTEGNYRVDFMFSVVSKSGLTKKLVVECDGHNYHERTKEQAAADRSRDRSLQELGYTVYRFTGSELHRDAFACARQVFRWADNASGGSEQ